MYNDLPTTKLNLGAGTMFR